MYPLLFRTVLVAHGSRDGPPRRDGRDPVAGRPAVLLGSPRADPARCRELRTTALGLRFESPFGVAAGFDKDVRGARGLHALGFGHVEVGTITAHPAGRQPAARACSG